MIKILRRLFNPSDSTTTRRTGYAGDSLAAFQNPDVSPEIPLLTDVVLIPENEPPATRVAASDPREAIETIIQDTLQEFVPLIAEAVATRLARHQRESGDAAAHPPFGQADPAASASAEPPRTRSG